MKERLDVLLVKQGLAESREKAKAVIMAGEVFVQGQREDKAGAMFDESKVTITVKGSSLRYVSRGGLKLEKAMACFPITLEGDICNLLSLLRESDCCARTVFRCIEAGLCDPV